MLAACLAILALMVGASVLAHRRLPPAARLPMPWGAWGGVRGGMKGEMRGKADWTAPRAVALGFMPALALLLLALAMLTPRQGRGDEMAPLVLMGFGLGAHLLHLALLRRALLRRGA